MKNNISDSLLEKTIEKMNELNEEALKELGFTVFDEEVDLSEDQEQQIIEFIIDKEIFAKGENLKNLWKAINDTDLVKINELKSNIADDEYVETLIISSLLNSEIHNNEIIKFLLTETEISEWSNLKAEMMLHFLDVENEAELNEEIIELLSIKNELGYQKALSSILSNRNISDDFFIKSFENSPNLDVNKPIIIKYGQDEALHDEEYSLLKQVIQSNHPVLAQHLVDKGATLLPNEVNSLLYNTNVSDELLIKIFEGYPNLDVNNPMIVKVCGLDGAFHDEEYSLLKQVIQFNRPVLAQYLVDKGATLLPNPNEVHSLLDNTKVSDEFLISCLENSPHLDVNKPIIIKIKYEQDEVFHDEERSLLMQSIQSNRLKLVEYLVANGAKLLLNEVHSLLYNTNVSDELLIHCLENSPDLDVNKPMIIKTGRASILQIWILKGYTFNKSSNDFIMNIQ